MKLLLLEPNKYDATSFYRARGVYPFLCRKHNIELVIGDFGNVEWTEAVLADVAVMQRPSHEHNVYSMTVLKTCGTKVIVDFDDDLLGIADHNPAFIHHNKNQEHTITCIKMADAVTVSTERLKHVYSRYNENIFVIPNALNDYIFPVAAKKKFAYNKTAYYRGGSTHQRDVYRYHAGIINVIKKNVDWDFYFIGDRFQFIEAHTEKSNNHHVRGYLPMMDFTALVNSMNPCVNMVFLENTPFNQGKSNCSWLEGTYAGAATFVPVGLPEFKEAIEYENFETAFTLFSKESLLYAAHEKSWGEIQRNYLLSQVNEKRMEVINSLH